MSASDIQTANKAADIAKNTSQRIPFSSASAGIVWFNPPDTLFYAAQTGGSAMGTQPTDAVGPVSELMVGGTSIDLTNRLPVSSDAPAGPNIATYDPASPNPQIGTTSFYLLMKLGNLTGQKAGTLTVTDAASTTGSIANGTISIWMLDVNQQRIFDAQATPAPIGHIQVVKDGQVSSSANLSALGVYQIPNLEGVSGLEVVGNGATVKPKLEMVIE